MPFSPESEFKEYFPNQALHTIKNIFVVAEGVFEAQSTNLNKVKLKLPNILNNQSSTKPSSNYKRLYRFFKDNGENHVELMQCLVSLCLYILGIKLSKTKRKRRGRQIHYLSLDGTSWQIGEKKIHLLTLAIVVGNISIPIWWEELDKKGTSNFEERKKVIEKGFEVLDLSGLCLLADREYIGEKWFKYLVDKGLDFVIRIKKTNYKKYVDSQIGFKTKDFKHQHLRHSALSASAQQAKYKNCGVCKQIQILDHLYTFVVFKNPKVGADEPLLYFISTLKKKRKIVHAYPIRWSIECCFKHLKTNGFNLEDMNFKNSNKVMLMMAITVLLYCLCIREGLLKYQYTTTKKWKHFKDKKVTLAVSIFTKGLENICGQFRDLASFLIFLSRIIIPDSITLKYNVQ